MKSKSKQVLVVGDRLLIQPDKGDKTSPAGLYLPPSVVEKQEVKGGIVVEVGPGIPLGSPNDWGRAADIAPLNDEGVPVMSLNVDNSKYFWYHHTNADTFDKVDYREFNNCIAAMAIMAYIVADMDEKLPR